MKCSGSQTHLAEVDPLRPSRRLHGRGALPGRSGATALQGGWATKIQLEDEAWRISGEAYEYVYIYILAYYGLFIYII